MVKATHNIQTLKGFLLIYSPTPLLVQPVQRFSYDKLIILTPFLQAVPSFSSEQNINMQTLILAVV